MAERIRTRFLVVGSGVAGLHTAWRASADGDVMVLTKRSLFDSATAYAQGGIAAALGAGDSPELHRQDTLAAGAALADAKAVQVLVEEGPARVRELATAGAQFDLEPGGNFKLGREAAHSRRRIVHAHGDQTGAEVARTLIRKVKESERIEVLEKARILDLIVEDGVVFGVRAAVAGKAVEIIADATVLATGGCGQVYRYTTNPQVATGDGYAIAHRAGAKLADMEFVQFHPTALDTPENPLQLISEAVRGEGAVLLNEEGERFMLKKHRLAELAPRDVGARDLPREGGRQAGLARLSDAGPGISGAVSGYLRHLSRARHRSIQGSDSGHARGALHDGRSRRRFARPIEPEPPVRVRGSLTNGSARGQPSRIELVAGRNRIRRARRARHDRHQEVAEPSAQE